MHFCLPIRFSASELSVTCCYAHYYITGSFDGTVAVWNSSPLCLISYIGSKYQLPITHLKVHQSSSCTLLYIVHGSLHLSCYDLLNGVFRSSATLTSPLRTFSSGTHYLVGTLYNGQICSWIHDKLAVRSLTPVGGLISLVVHITKDVFLFRTTSLWYLFRADSNSISDFDFPVFQGNDVHFIKKVPNSFIFLVLCQQSLYLISFSSCFTPFIIYSYSFSLIRLIDVNDLLFHDDQLILVSDSSNVAFFVQFHIPQDFFQKFPANLSYSLEPLGEYSVDVGDSDSESFPLVKDFPCSTDSNCNGDQNEPEFANLPSFFEGFFKMSLLGKLSLSGYSRVFGDLLVIRQLSGIVNTNYELVTNLEDRYLFGSSSVLNNNFLFLIENRFLLCSIESAKLIVFDLFNGSRDMFDLEVEGQDNGNSNLILIDNVLVFYYCQTFFTFDFHEHSLSSKPFSFHTGVRNEPFQHPLDFSLMNVGNQGLFFAALVSSKVYVFSIQNDLINPFVLIKGIPCNCSVTSIDIKSGFVFVVIVNQVNFLESCCTFKILFSNNERIFNSVILDSFFYTYNTADVNINKNVLNRNQQSNSFITIKDLSTSNSWVQSLEFNWEKLLEFFKNEELNPVFLVSELLSKFWICSIWADNFLCFSQKNSFVLPSPNTHIDHVSLTTHSPFYKTSLDVFVMSLLLVKVDPSDGDLINFASFSSNLNYIPHLSYLGKSLMSTNELIKNASRILLEILLRNLDGVDLCAILEKWMILLDELLVQNSCLLSILEVFGVCCLLFHEVKVLPFNFNYSPLIKTISLFASSTLDCGISGIVHFADFVSLIPGVFTSEVQLLGQVFSLFFDCLVYNSGTLLKYQESIVLRALSVLGSAFYIQFLSHCQILMHRVCRLSNEDNRTEKSFLLLVSCNVLSRILRFNRHCFNSRLVDFIEVLICIFRNSDPQVFPASYKSVYNFLKEVGSLFKSVSFCPIGLYLVVATADNTGQFQFFDLRTRVTKIKPLIIKGHSSRVTFVEFSPCGHYFSSFSQQTLIFKIWKVNDLCKNRLFYKPVGREISLQNERISHSETIRLFWESSSVELVADNYKRKFDLESVI
ncbi:hypothetical protein P9112_009012 [Eukaryota sp. TZLM1-RC]